MFRQAWALILLRFTLFRRMISPAKLVSLAVQTVFVLIILAVSLAVAVGLFFLGLNMNEIGEPEAMLVITDMLVIAFLVIWLIGVISELQRSDVIDFRKMLYLPVSLKQVFILNFLVSLVTPGLVAFILAATGLILGLILGTGPHMLWAVPLALAFVFMVAAWTYYARGLLAVLMENKRRRRAILVLLPAVFVLVFQIPNLLIAGSKIVHQFRSPRTVSKQLDELIQQQNNKESQQIREELDAIRDGKEQRSVQLKSAFLIGNKIIPFGWLPYGLSALEKRDVKTAGVCMTGLVAVGTAGLGLGYRSTVRFYMGARRRRKNGRKKRGARKKEEKERSSRLLESTLPFVDDDTSAFVAAQLVSYLRHPNIRMQLVMPVIMSVVILAVIPSIPAKPALRALMPALILLWPMLGFSMIMFNMFGVDGEGFRALILLPTERRKYVLGKNLALFPLAGGLCFLFLLAGALVFRFGVASLAIGLMQTVQTYLLFCIAGNFVSLFNPYRFGPDAMRATGLKIFSSLMILGTVFLIPLMMLPTVFCLLVDPVTQLIWAHHGFSFGLAVSAAFLTVTIYAYRRSVIHAGNLLARREQIILDKLFRDRE